MQAFDIDVLDIAVYNLGIVRHKVVHLDSAVTIPDPIAEAYYPIPDDLRTFLLSYHQQYGVVGFTYDFEKGGHMLGLIINARE